ncbi:hypothetical protein QP938_10480 [Porticoccaceae bacterium LTM1]|nr:hypothetical protein QP938_10480 [Porticoccaceae bacterium LTM1]
MADQNGFNSIVPDQDERIGARGNRAGAPKPAARPRPEPSGNGGGTWKILVIVLVLVVGAMGWFGWQQHQQLTTLQSSFDNLQARLASTDDSLSKSGAALQLKIKEQEEELGKHWAEIKKLWGVSYDINKKDIASNKDTAAKNTGRIAKLEKSVNTVAQLSKNLDLASKKLAEISASTLAANVEMEDVQQRLRETTDKLNTIDQSFNRWRQDVDKRLKSSEEAVEAIDAYRRQINQELLQLRKQLTGSNSSVSQSAPVASPAAGANY